MNMSNLEQLKHLSTDYHGLIQRIDDHIAGLEKKYSDVIACRKGCDSCCRNLSLFPVEAFCLALEFITIPDKTRVQVEKRIRNFPDECPLLVDHACVLYHSRPVICRTHGYPITIEKKGQLSVDFCPENFKGIRSFPGESLLSLDQLNLALAAVNRQFVSSIETDPPLPERIDMADALFLLS